MARTVLLDNSPKSAGDYPFGPVSIPDGLSLVTLDIDMTVARSGDNITWVAEFSLDAGVTWPLVSRGQFLGGVPTRLDGGVIDPVLISTDTVRLPTGTNRRVRGTATITGATRKIPVGLEFT